MDTNIIKRFASIFGSKIAVLFFTIITTPVIVRLLGSEKYGDYSFLLSTLQWLLVLVFAGSFNGIRKYVSEDRESEHWESAVFGFYLKIVLIIAVLTAIGILVVANSRYVTRHLGPEFPFYLMVLALLIPLRAIFRTSRSMLMGMDLERFSEPLKVLDRFVFAGLVLGLFYVGGDIVSILAGRVVSVGLVAILALGLVYKWSDSSIKVFRASTRVPRSQLLKYALPTEIVGWGECCR